MNPSKVINFLSAVFKDESLFGFSQINGDLADREGCKCAIVTLLPYPNLDYNYNPIEYLVMLENLRKRHSGLMDKVKDFFDDNNVVYKAPPATPNDDGNHRADLSYKWAAVHAGLGFIGKNDVFIHYKYSQKVRISCLLVDLEMLLFTGDVLSECGDCDLCVKACPYNFISGKLWHMDIHRDELIDYKKCATKTKHSGDGLKYACGYCVMACKYPNIQ